LSPEEWVQAQWERCAPFIDRAVERADGAFDLEYVKTKVFTNQAQLWPGQNSAVVTRLETHPSGLLTCLLWLAGGDDLSELKALEKAISAWAKAMGCERMEIIGRRGWLKALDDYREGSTVLVRNL
jgi:hypothetical protein